MNVTAHLEKEKNEETKTGKKRAGEERKKKTGDRFWRSCVLPFCGCSGGSIVKK